MIQLKNNQEQAGNRRDTFTPICTHVTGDFMNAALRRALALPFGGQPAEDRRG
jgi:hypothetical protein